jgi:hypothetical protein
VCCLLFSLSFSLGLLLGRCLEAARMMLTNKTYDEVMVMVVMGRWAPKVGGS